MLIYIRGERGVGKNKVVKIIKIEFTLLGRKKELVILLLQVLQQIEVMRV